MAPVTFPCEHCGKLMGVRPEYLGQKVRCPHCQQVIAAPTSDPTAPPPAAVAPPPEPVFVPPPPVVHTESIFESAEEGAGDALFDGPPQPLVEMPPEPALLDIQVETTPPQGTPFQAVAAPPIAVETPAPPLPPLSDAAQTEAQTEPAAPSGDDLAFTRPQAGDGAAAPFPPPTELDAAAAGQELEGETVGTLATLAKVRRPARGGLLVPTLLIFLIPYAIVTTVAVILLYLKKQEPSLEVLPDPKPDKESGGPSRRGENIPRVRPDLKVPPRLLARLRQPVQVGDLEVVPRKVELLPGNRLCLSLTLRNLSADVDFNPVSDAFLEHHWNVPAAPKPYTFLEVLGTSHRLYGGQWQTNGGSQEFPGRLGPGQQMKAYLTTDRRDGPKVRGLDNSRGPLLWRVQVRRGFIRYQGKDVSATAVIGVEFHFQDIEKDRRITGEGAARAK